MRRARLASQYPCAALCHQRTDQLYRGDRWRRGTTLLVAGMFAYDAKSQKFFSSKFFGAHINSAAAMDEGGMGTYGEDWQFYLDNLLGPVAAPAKRLLDRIGITVVEENKVPEGVTTAFEKECVARFSTAFASDPPYGWLMHVSRLPDPSASRHARLPFARTGSRSLAR
jgi:hypothetical protein